MWDDPRRWSILKLPSSKLREQQQAERPGAARIGFLWLWMLESADAHDNARGRKAKKYSSTTNSVEPSTTTCMACDTCSRRWRRYVSIGSAFGTQTAEGKEWDVRSLSLIDCYCRIVNCNKLLSTAAKLTAWVHLASLCQFGTKSELMKNVSQVLSTNDPHLFAMLVWLKYKHCSAKQYEDFIHPWNVQYVQWHNVDWHQ